MTDHAPPSRAPKAPPRAAGIAGVIFSVLLMISIALIRLALPTEPDSWVTDPTRRNAVSLALNLVPFAGIAFLWFMGVLRNRVGALEDQFFATVFFGSGLLFIAMLFAGAATAGGLLQAITANSGRLPDTEAFATGRATSYMLLNAFGVKMAGVFIISTCTIGLRTTVIPRWLALVGYACALALLLIITDWPWIALVFPLWILVVSAYILVEEFRQGHGEAVGDPIGPPSQREAPTA